MLLSACLELAKNIENTMEAFLITRPCLQCGEASVEYIYYTGILLERNLLMVNRVNDNSYNYRYVSIVLRDNVLGQKCE